MSAADPSNLIGTVVAERYRVQNCLGSGTMGAVYRAEHIHMKKTVALKVLHPSHTRDPEVVERFQREAQAAANIEHPNICVATDFGKLDQAFYYLVMEYLEGRPLIDVIKSGAQFDEARALHIGVQMLSALEKAHEMGVVHRDLKPENVILISREGDPDFVKITDFGIWDRCLSRGMPGSMLTGAYNMGIRVMQSPGLVVIPIEMVHETRMVYLDGRAAPPPEYPTR